VRALQARKHLYELAVSEDSRAASATRATPIQVLSWTLNDVNNIARNLRLDQAVNHASAIAIATAAAHGVKSD
jgi:TPP-dependent indolepyruvate ferredoxin oxidoreductase alpha subunit